MPTLRELQAGFRDALLGGDEQAAAAAVRGDGLGAAARLAVYRHHVFTTLTAALESTYPVVVRLVDARFFRYAADQYIREHPPVSRACPSTALSLATSSRASSPAGTWPTCPTSRGWSGR